MRLTPWRSGAPLVLLAVLASGCSGPVTESPPLECDFPVSHDLGSPGVIAPARFTMTAGRVRVDYSHQSTESLFGEIYEKGRVYIDDGGTTPSPDPDHPGHVLAAHRLVVSIDESVTVDLPAGSYWLVTSQGQITLASCPDVTVSGVVAGLPGGPITYPPSMPPPTTIRSSSAPTENVTPGASPR
jgi:hypothetical protein